ncbi:unnamed protein product [Angiostrongylus costaricensis]|uniref:Peptidase A1 domain-containing protein n=1 Tax=Angiostrongylus costaricensis TaxID=334426 RepID=A0A158PME0_ANGCS|nr:unnamed protein product [Angiostrongylus costaricensis]
MPQTAWNIRRLLGSASTMTSYLILLACITNSSIVDSHAINVVDAHQMMHLLKVLDNGDHMYASIVTIGIADLPFTTVLDTGSSGQIFNFGIWLRFISNYVMKHEIGKLEKLLQDCSEGALGVVFTAPARSDEFPQLSIAIN